MLSLPLTLPIPAHALCDLECDTCTNSAVLPLVSTHIYRFTLSLLQAKYEIQSKTSFLAQQLQIYNNLRGVIFALPNLLTSGRAKINIQWIFALP